MISVGKFVKDGIAMIGRPKQQQQANDRAESNQSSFGTPIPPEERERRKRKGENDGETEEEGEGETKVNMMCRWGLITPVSLISFE